MQASAKTELPPPPGVIGALVTGLDAISARLWVILPPLVLDLFLWVGPHLSIRRLTVGLFDQMLLMNEARGYSLQEIAGLQEVLANFNVRFNVFALLRTFPIGISSLLSGRGPLLSPLGTQNVIEVTSGLSLLSWFVALTFLGWALGGLYFRWVAEAAGSHAATLAVGRAVTQTLFFSILLSIFGLIISVPFFLLVVVLQLINPALPQILFLIIALMAVWIVVPIFFAPHGIFVRRQNALASMLASLRMARFTLPLSSTFVLAVLVLSQGLNFLWRVPAEDSWLLLVGLTGHAFITTVLLAASFIYYRDMNIWLQAATDHLKPGATAPQM